MAARRTRRALDAAAYAVVVCVVTFLLAAVVGAATGRGLVGAKWGMFVVGMATMAYSAVRLRAATPRTAEEAGASARRPSAGQSGLLARVSPRLLPAHLRLPIDERPSPAAKLFVASLAVLAGSAALEVVFGVGVSPS
jgi:hypothetical protein